MHAVISIEQVNIDCIEEIRYSDSLQSVNILWLFSLIKGPRGMTGTKGERVSVYF